MKVNELLKIADKNNAKYQMDNRQYQCLIALIEDEYITSVEQLSEYITIKS
jgi:hypothetical protein